MTVDQAIETFFNESFDLAMCDNETITRAAQKMEEQNLPYACDIIARWDDYQEELRCMLMEELA